jgi:glycosyltransferase involved in cell wall biosynthesis
LITASEADSDSDADRPRTQYSGSALVVGRALHAPWNEGTRVVTRNFVRAAARHRPVRLVSLTQERFRSRALEHVPNGITVDHVYSSSGYDLLGVYRGLPGLVRYLNGSQSAHRSEVAHLFGVSLSLAPILRQRGCRVVVHAMTASARPRDRLVNAASTYVFGRWVDRFAVTSNVLGEMLHKRGIPRSRLVVLPPAIDTEVFRPGSKSAARQVLGLDPVEPLVVYLGRLTPRRFPAEPMAHALRELAATNTHGVRLVAVSPGATHDGSENTAAYVQACTTMVQTALQDVRGLSMDVRSMDLSDESKVDWLRAADAVVLPFAEPETVEPPLTLLEALACGAQVVLTPAANRSGIIRDGHNGFVSSAPAAVGSALRQVLTQTSAAREISDQARRTVTEGFSIQSVGVDTTRLWDELPVTTSVLREAAC